STIRFTLGCPSTPLTAWLRFRIVRSFNVVIVHALPAGRLKDTSGFRLIRNQRAESVGCARHPLHDPRASAAHSSRHRFRVSRRYRPCTSEKSLETLPSL